MDGTEIRDPGMPDVTRRGTPGVRQRYENRLAVSIWRAGSRQTIRAPVRRL
jgi:hypothetical protein